MKTMVFSVMDPWAIIRGRWPEALAQCLTLKRAREVGEDRLVGRKYLQDVTKTPPTTKTWPSLKDLEEFDSVYRNWKFVSIDIESVGHFITIVGFTLFDWERVGPTLVLPFKKRGGLDYWNSWESHLRATEYLYSWLEVPEPGKWFHNGVTFDVPMLRAAGFDVEGELWDTMNLAHYTYPEMKKGLQYLSTAHLGFANWKSLLKEEDDNEGKS